MQESAAIATDLVAMQKLHTTGRFATRTTPLRRIDDVAEPEPFGELLYAGAESVGVPGQRRFRLKLMREDGGAAMLWLEKEQLSALGDAIETVLSGEGYQAGASTEQEEPVFPLHADIEYRVAQLSMGLYRDERTIIISSVPVPEAETSGPEDGISFRLNYADASRLRQEIVRVVAAGRPPCPLCGGPIDASGHICPRQNGHHKQG
jgi:uncharacterized repeat protein (TIGR03847 family)